MAEQEDVAGKRPPNAAPASWLPEDDADDVLSVEVEWRDGSTEELLPEFAELQVADGTVAVVEKDVPRLASWRLAMDARNRRDLERLPEIAPLAGLARSVCAWQTRRTRAP